MNKRLIAIHVGHAGEYGMVVQMEVGFYDSGAWPLFLAERAPVRHVAMAPAAAGHHHPAATVILFRRKFSSSFFFRSSDSTDS